MSLCNGGSNYAITIRQKEEKKGILIGCGSDDKSMPYFSKGQVSIIIHEILHHFTNARILKYWDQIDSSAQIIYSHVKDDMYKLAYGSARTTMIEWFVNLFIVMYFQDFPQATDYSTDHIIDQFHKEGFIWMKRSLDFMKNFRDNRNLYVVVDDFMAQLVGFIKFTADNFDYVVNEFNDRRPYVVETFPMTGSTVDIYTDTIRIRFSEPMIGAFGFKSIDDDSIYRLPLLDENSWENEYTYRMLIDKNKLQKGKIYGILLIRYGFVSKKQYAMKDDYKLFFETE